MKIGKVKPQTVDNFQYDTWVKHDELDLAMPTETIQGPYSGFGSAEFTSGSSTYLSMADHADWDIGGSLVDNWTIDFWIKLKTIVGGTPHAFISQREDGSNEWHIQIYPGTDWGFRITSGASPYVTLEESDTSGFAVGVWYHIAVCKVGSDWGLYKDGVQKAYASQSSTDTFGAALEIGRMGALGRYLNGFMSEMRIINSNPFSASPVVGLTDTITPPTGVHTSDANTHLLLHFNEDYTDSGNTGHTVTPTDTVLNWTETKLLMHGERPADASGTAKQITANGTAQAFSYKWGTSAGGFDGASSYLSVPTSSDWNLISDETTEYSVECWIRATDTSPSAIQQIIGQFEDINNYWKIIIHNTNGFQLEFYSNGSTWTFASSNVFLPDNDWHHLCVANLNADWGVYLDGKQILYLDQNGHTDTFTGALLVGKNYNANHYFGGSIDEIRIEQDNIFSVAPNSGKTDTITVPTGAYTATGNTNLLLHLDSNVTDSGDTTHTVTNNGMLFATTKFGTGSYYLDGNSDYFSIPTSTDFSNIYNTVYEDWTLETWVKHDDHAGTEVYFGNDGTGANPYWYLAHIHGTGLSWNSGQPNIMTVTGGEITDTNWHHVAAIKRGPLYGIYLDGVLTGGSYDTSTGAVAYPMYIGSNGSPGSFFDGYMEDLRIAKGNVYNADPLPSPYAHYKCNDNAASTTVTDDGTGANNGTSSTNTSNLSTTGKVNEAFDFVAASSEYVNLSTMATDITTDLTGTFSLWFNIDALGSIMGLINFTKNDAADQNYFYIRVNADGTLQCVVRSGTTDRMGFNTGSAITAAAWHHVAVTQNGDQYHVYVDGVDVTGDVSLIYTETGGWLGTNSSSYNTGNIGRIQLSNGTPSNYFDGKIDDVRYYQDVALSASQIAQIYNSGSGTEGLGDDITIPTATLTGDDPVASYTFSGLDGNTDETYKIVGTVNHAITGSSNTIIHLNGDTSSNSYYQQFLAYGTTESAGRGTRTGPVIGYTGSVGYYTSTVTLISAKSGKPRLVDAQWLGDATGTTIGYIGKESCVWNNSDDNISSIVVDPDGWIGTGSKITLYKKVSR